MDLRQLRYFVVIVEATSITRASQLLHVAQPALSYHLSNLESHLNTKLLHRTPNGITPTESGSLLYKHAKSVLRQMENLEISVGNKQSQLSGKVTIGLPGSTSRILAIPLLKRLEAYPGILLEIVERQSGALAELVAQAQVDIAITVDANAPPGVTMTPLANEELFAILPATYKNEDDGLTLEALCKLPLVLPSRPNITRLKLDLATVEAGLTYRLLAEASTTDLLVRMVRNGEVCTILPWSAVTDEIVLGQVVTAVIKQPSLNRELSLCVSSTIPLSHATEVVRQLTIESFSSVAQHACWRLSSASEPNAVA